MANAPRNSLLAPGVTRFSRSKVYSRRALWKRNKGTTAPAAPKAAATTKTVQVNGEKNGKERVVALNKAPRYYPAHDVSRPIRAHKTVRPTKLRASITPGTVLILLAGRFRGKRVVFLKQLSSGLLLVTGPYKVNGVPLRRVNQAYVIATSTRVELDCAKVDEKFNDDYFKREKAAKNKKATEEEFFGDKAKKPTLAEGRAADQKAVDAAILAAVNKVPMLHSYLGAKFSLSKGQAPHALKF
ncbi:ribosomal protein L6e-domain-containing protein [Thamnocephalis sphaerospora]|uniref:Ribosomal protein L6e-domain-containing protein n=1 Tax=Thamnocephalis sphaerospora TaxID=78915 RepID=A0A4P9XPN8_9FUNG|nr:ribosomal protein L6e-domain-containing protein [Thamnocephalis sphaerospora]|eukprot:RKP07230.1 ribosomal protein L6e-domain-containing protein [Thamnocephalis sphaerospora]